MNERGANVGDDLQQRTGAILRPDSVAWYGVWIGGPYQRGVASVLYTPVASLMEI